MYGIFGFYKVNKQGFIRKTKGILRFQGVRIISEKRITLRITQMSQQNIYGQNPTQIIKRFLQYLQENQLINKETTRDQIKQSGTDRPSLTMRTIKDGINHKYKRENDNRQQRHLQSKINQQRQFHKEVIRKLEKVQRRRITCWNSECLAPETPEIYSD